MKDQSLCYDACHCIAEEDLEKESKDGGGGGGGVFNREDIN